MWSPRILVAPLMICNTVALNALTIIIKNVKKVCKGHLC